MSSFYVPAVTVPQIDFEGNLTFFSVSLIFKYLLLNWIDNVQKISCERTPLIGVRNSKERDVLLLTLC